MLYSSRHTRIVAASVLLGASMVLSACGYRPLYGQFSDDARQHNGAAALAAIKVMPMPDRTGQVMRTALQRRLNLKSNIVSEYQLRVTLTESVAELAVEQNSFATRANLTLTAQYQLVRSADSLLLTTGSQRAVASYNIILSDFATLAAQANARERAIESLADELQTRLASYFVRPAPPLGAAPKP